MSAKEAADFIGMPYSWCSPRELISDNMSRATSKGVRFHYAGQKIRAEELIKTLRRRATSAIEQLVNTQCLAGKYKPHWSQESSGRS